MRILFLSNFYPPARSGGYTQWCYEVAQGLEDRGHTVGILTSRHEVENVTFDDPQVRRLLHLEGDLNYYRPLQFFTSWRRNHRDNLARTRQVIEGFDPDVVFVWGMWALSRAVPALLEQLLPWSVVYYLSDYWPSAVDMHTAFWRTPARGWAMRLPKRLGGAIVRAVIQREGGQPELAFRNACCVSAAVRDILVADGLPLTQARIIHGGTDTSRFANVAKRGRTTGPLRLLYAGQLASHKGVHTAVAAMKKLVDQRGGHLAHLTVMGSGHPDYEARLHEQVEEAGLQSAVSFRAAVSREEMPAVLQQFDVLIFPSVYEEPLARMTQEAMAAGLVVIGTTTGGTKEILVHGENGLTFPAENDRELAIQIARLVDHPELVKHLSEAGRQTIIDYFNLDRMIAEIEVFLQDVLNQRKSADSLEGAF